MRELKKSMLAELKAQRISELDLLKQKHAEKLKKYSAKLDKERENLVSKHNENLYQTMKSLGLEVGKYFVMWEKEVLEIGKTPEEEQIVFGRVLDINYSADNEPYIKAEDLFGIMYESSEARRKNLEKNFKHYYYVKIKNTNYVDLVKRKVVHSQYLVIDDHGIQPIQEDLYNEMKNFMFTDSGERYLMMHEKFAEIKKELKNRGFKVRVHLL